MQFSRLGTEAEMIAEFLLQELASVNRYQRLIADCLDAGGVDPGIILSPDLLDDDQNALRRRVLGRYRGYGTDRPSFFTGFPTQGVDWWWVALSSRELLDCRYIRYSYWNELSFDTRSPRVAANWILTTPAAPMESDPAYLTVFTDLADQLRAGCRLPPLILVSAAGGLTRTVLEGHTRLTAYALAPDTLPEPIDVLLGLSTAIANWDMYSCGCWPEGGARCR